MCDPAFDGIAYTVIPLYASVSGKTWTSKTMFLCGFPFRQNYTASEVLKLKKKEIKRNKNVLYV